ESVRSQQLQQRRGLFLAAEEQVVFVAAKRAETGKRIGTPGVGGVHHSASFACRMAATKSVSNPGANESSACRSTFHPPFVRPTPVPQQGEPRPVACQLQSATTAAAFYCATADRGYFGFSSAFFSSSATSAHNCVNAARSSAGSL